MNTEYLFPISVVIGIVLIVALAIKGKISTSVSKNGFDLQAEDKKNISKIKGDKNKLKQKGKDNESDIDGNQNNVIQE